MSCTWYSEFKWDNVQITIKIIWNISYCYIKYITELPALPDPAGDSLKIKPIWTHKFDNLPDWGKPFIFYVFYVILQISLMKRISLIPGFQGANGGSSGKAKK